MARTWDRGSPGVAAFGIVLLCIAAGCASTAKSNNSATVSSDSVSGYSDAGLVAGRANSPELDALWKERRNDTKDFAIGPGDVLEIRAPSAKEIDGREVRVDGKGNIDLPLLGTLHVGGLSENEVNTLLVNRIGDYLYHPQAEIFVRSYNNRQVAVSGEVRKPDEYVINSPDETIRDVLQRAGGMTSQASPEIVLMPADSSADRASAPSAGMKADVSAVGQNQTLPGPEGSDSNTLEVKKASTNIGQALVIDLSKNANQQRYLELPVRPGDTIYVPSGGIVYTVGWVYHTTPLPVTYKLSVAGAVAASGGMLFAADPHDVKILRRQTSGYRAIQSVDLARIESGEIPDVQLRDGDIVDVSYVWWKIPGYAFYYAAQGFVNLAPSALLINGF